MAEPLSLCLGGTRVPAARPSVLAPAKPARPVAHHQHRACSLPQAIIRIATLGFGHGNLSRAFVWNLVRRRPEADSEGHAEEPGTWAGLTTRRGLAAAMAMRDGCGLTMEVLELRHCFGAEQALPQF